MLTLATKSGIISRLSSNLLSKTSTKRIVLQLNRSGNYIEGYVNHNVIRIFKRKYKTLLQSSIKSFSSDVGSPYSAD